MDIDASELSALLNVLEGAERDAAQRTYPVVEEYAERLRNDWRDNARATARRHGKHYPNAITAEQIPALGEAVWEVGPETRRRQGGMGRGFEYGGPNQPPHLDGNRAVTGIEPAFLKAIEEIAEGLL